LRNRLRKFIIAYRIGRVNTAGARFLKYIFSNINKTIAISGFGTGAANRNETAWPKTVNRNTI